VGRCGLRLAAESAVLPLLLVGEESIELLRARAGTTGAVTPFC